MRAPRPTTPLLLVLALVAFILVACSEESPAATPLPYPPAPGPTAAHAIHWGYEGAEGPSHWGSLDPTFVECSAGTSQSPVEITSPTLRDLPDIAFQYQPSEVRIINNGHTVQVNYDAGSYIELDGKRHDLVQFHYHAPSEHAVNGKLHAAEAHLVHKAPDSTLAVIGVLFDLGEENPALGPVWENLPLEAGVEKATGVRMNADDMLPADRSAYRYNGSLTTPPCTEGVTWLVLSNAVVIGEAQLEAFERLFEGNNRPLQDLNTRDVILDMAR